MKELDTNNAVPLYEQLRIALRERLESQALAPGERLPSEAQLCQKYGVSRITVRRAVDDLVEEGYLERRQGKGTFVAQKRAMVSVMALLDENATEGFNDRYRERKRSLIVSKKEYPANRNEREWLHLGEKDSVYVLTRQMILDGKLWMIDRATYCARRYPGFMDRVKDDVSTYRILGEVYGVKMRRAHREITLTYATNEQGKLLGCAPGTPLFKTFKIVYDERNEPVHLSSTFTQADGVVLTVENDNSMSRSIPR